MILTGEPMGAAEAARRSAWSRESCRTSCRSRMHLALAAQIATKSPIALRLAKEAVNAAYEMP